MDLKVAILTVSTTRDLKDDSSGDLLEKILREKNYKIVYRDIVKDNKRNIEKKIIHASDVLEADILFTTGGTGLGPYDVTPEATLEVAEKVVPGISEYLRSEGAKKTKYALLSRSVSAVRNSTLIINLPGSPRGVEESLELIIDLLEHAVKMIHGKSH